MCAIRATFVVSTSEMRSKRLAAAMLAVAWCGLWAARAVADAPRVTGTFIPVVINRYPNSGVSEQEAKDAVKAANELLKQANIKLVIVDDLGPDEITNHGDTPGGGDSGDGEFTSAERTRIRTFGGNEINGLKEGNDRGVKLAFGKVPIKGHPTAPAESVGPRDAATLARTGGNPTIVLRENTTVPGGPGKIIAHELGHTMGIDGDYDNSGWIMDKNGRGGKFKQSEIDQMNKRAIKFKYGKCARQFKGGFPAFKQEVQSGATTDDQGDQGGGGARVAGISAIYDLHQVFLTSENDVTDSNNIDSEITVWGVLPENEDIDALYTLGFDIDDNPMTGISYGGYSGIDRIVYVSITGNITEGTLTVIGEVENTLSGSTYPLAQTPTVGTVDGVDFEGESEAVGSVVAFYIPKDLLDLSAVQVSVVATAGTSSSIFDTTDHLIFDSESWLNDPTLQTFGDGVPTPGAPYPFDISGLVPNDSFSLYLDETLILTDTLDATGSFSADFIFPIDMSNTDMHFLTAQDSTGDFAYSITCPEPGACCHKPGHCTDDVTKAECSGLGDTFFAEQTCAQVEPCPAVFGACCVKGYCTDDVAESECESGKWWKDTPCSDPAVVEVCAAQIPTVSEWGLIVLALAMMTIGTIALGRAKHGAAVSSG